MWKKNKPDDKPNRGGWSARAGRGRGGRNWSVNKNLQWSEKFKCSENLFSTLPGLRRSSLAGSTHSLASEFVEERGDNGRGRQNGASRQSGMSSSSLNGSNQSLASETNGDRGRGRGRGRGNSDRPRISRGADGQLQNVTPLRYRQLQDLYKNDPNEILISLVDEGRGLKELLNSPTLGIEMFIDILKTITKALSTQLHTQNQNSLMAMLLTTNFFKIHVPCAIWGPDIRNNLKVFEYLSDIFSTFLTKMPGSTCKELEICVKQCVTVSDTIPGIDRTAQETMQDVLKKIEATEEERKNEMHRKRKKVQMAFHHYQDEPPEDFRELNVAPSIDEIRTRERPFLRENKTTGSYRDADHYLDVHFRLLREDFIAPLRDGIINYVDSKNKKERRKTENIRLYENVQIKEPHYTRDGVYYILHFDTRQFGRIKWEISRRLIFGSLLCLSCDNFDTAIFASVTDRKPEELKNGNIMVKFEDDFDIQKELTNEEQNALYTMAESSAYFEAYRHVLRGLQTYNDENLPLQQYIVHTQQHRECPAYLDYESTYNLSCVLKDELTEDRSELEAPSLERYASRRARVADIQTWPSAESLGLDESQRRAMHLALSSALAVIQGPPGTGKTYVGLKIVKALLSNKPVWQNEEEKNPILVVCLTNHALDQFLEGMISFTSRLVRVGGRSKNENLRWYNLRLIQEMMQRERSREPYIHKNVEQSHWKLKELRGRMEFEKQMGLLLRDRVLHEKALKGFDGHDVLLVRSLVQGFMDYFGVVPFNELWCPKSFLATWLGLTLEFEFVPEEMVDNLFHDDTREWQMVGDGGRNVTRGAAGPDLKLIADLQNQFEIKNYLTGSRSNPRWVDGNKDQTVTQLQETLGVDEDDDGGKFVDVEDEAMAANRHRQMEANDMVEVELQIPKLDSSNWSVIVERLDDPWYLKREDEKICDEDMLNLYAQMGTVRRIIAQRELSNTDWMRDEEVGQIENVWEIDNLADRWRLYRRWIEKFKQGVNIRIGQLQKEYEREAKRLKEVMNEEELSILKNNDVVGMTTTGAAKYLETLRELKPKIVIVEEAAEVLEAHIITALSSSTEHLILIGDHQQLRPNVTVYRLAKDYDLEVSLFERMIKNDVHYETLQLQHRMRPEISRLLVPHIYKSLEDHEVVRKYPHINGMTTDVFFFNHNNPEEEVADSKTHQNIFEAKYLVALCDYLLKQDYQPEQITVLTAYAGQLFALKRLMPKEKYEGVQVTVVDNFQGEENDIILLSFVRSNEEGKIGFLKIDNRVNVALSRAKIGLYCVGNFKFFASKSELWRGIVNSLERHGHIGEELTLVCQKHSRPTTIRCPQDFLRYAPEGGCLRLCEEVLPCRHICSRVCHVTPHNRCEEICGKVICELGHTCPMKCFLPCGDCDVKVYKNHVNCNHAEYQPCHVDMATVKCKVLMMRELNCDHKVQLECHIDYENYKCLVEVVRTLPHCNHDRQMLCHEDVSKVQCKVNCGMRLDCGHACPRNCHPLDDPDHEKTECKKKCEKTCTRGHKCKNLCYQSCSECMILVDKERSCGHIVKHPCSKDLVENVSSLTFIGHSVIKADTLERCTQPCEKVLLCGHPCKKKCHEPCGDCKEEVTKVLRCGHAIQAECGLAQSQVKCTAPCLKMLLCGHRCPLNCGQSCNWVKCTYPIVRRGNCGHSIETPCHLSNEPERKFAQFCQVPCGTLLPCEHDCKGTCGDCRQGRVHVPCQRDCGRTQICGHSCTFPCATVCPPCNRKCMTQCAHSKCPMKCGQPCKKCKEKCMWRCPHKWCSALCGEMCDRDRCNEPCRKFLPCNHPCIGLCGEKCPKLCRVCNWAELTEFILFGFEEEPGARFIQLPDCGHCIEVQALDHWMEMDDDGDRSIQMKECPCCKTTIWKCSRYGNIIKERVEEIHQVKKRVFGKSLKLLRKTMHEAHMDIIRNANVQQHFSTETYKLVKRLTGKRPVHQNQLTVIRFQVQILKMMSNMKEKFFYETCAGAKDFFKGEVDFLVNRLMKNEEKMNEFEIKDIEKELIRVSLNTMFLHAEESTRGTTNITTIENLNRARIVLKNHLKLTEEEEKNVEDYIRRASDFVPGLGITNTEKEMIVKALTEAPKEELGRGHWFKCRNGHLYVIGECGGAMERGLCPECGANIGGERHAVDPSNAHTGIMDGSEHPAWSEQTALGNYDLRELH